MENIDETDRTDNEEPPLFMRIFEMSGNHECADCKSKDPDWASLGFGVLICLQCAGSHRSLGVHISLVRSLNLDSWTPKQLCYLIKGGNEKFAEHVSECSSSTSSSCKVYTGKDSFESKYNNPQILYYRIKISFSRYPIISFLREILESRIDNREPEEYSPLSYEEQCSISSSKRDDGGNEGPTWGRDKDILECFVCKTSFSFLTRRHHCRRCGKCVCSKCAPSKNSRPIIEWGLKDSVRHCKLCYMSPMIKWKHISNMPESTKSTSCSSRDVINESNFGAVSNL